jgi:5-methyltetrahydropteroyltriglutamate--homocysteine methyltransferase
MCYSECQDIYHAIVEMDADVISVKSSHSGMELLSSVANDPYPNAIDPEVYDIHLPRVPSAAEIENLIEDVLQVILAERLCINPGCGLKIYR